MKKLFVGRLDKRTRPKDVEDIFEAYGKLSRCEVKYGTDTAYAFVDYDRDTDAEEAVRGENGRKLNGSTIVVEWARGKRKQFPDRDSSVAGSGDGYRGDGFRGNDFRSTRRGINARHFRPSGSSTGDRRRARTRSRSKSRSRSASSRSRSRSRSRS